MGLIIGIILFLLLSAFFSGSEIAFISANKLSVAVKKDDDTRRSKILASFYEKPKTFISTMLVGNNIALVVFTSFMTTLIKPYIVPFTGDGVFSLLIYTLIITAVVLIFGEFLPKTLSRLFADKLLYAFAFPLAFFKYLLSIPTYILTALSNFLLKYVARVPIDKIDISLTRVDLENYISENLAEEGSDIDKEILTNALTLNQQKVRDCLIPRTEVVAIDQYASLEELVDLFKKERHSRIIVIENDIENVLGYIHHQQLFSNKKTIKKLLLDIPFVPEAMNLKDLMSQFIRDNVTIACVVDEYGSVSGIITLEDILEEIFGEIEDEHDHEDFIDIMVSENEYLFSGRLEISTICEKYDNINLPEGEYQTLSGYIVMTSGSIPEEGAELELDGYRFILESMSDTKIETVRMIKLETEYENE